MRKEPFLLALVATVGLSAGSCGHDDMTTNPNVAMPAVSMIQPNPTHADSVLIIAGTHFDQTATFDLRQGGAVKATLLHPILATGDAASGIQINATIPAGTALGKYQACVTTGAGTGCGAVLVEVFSGSNPIRRRAYTSARGSLASEADDFATRSPLRYPARLERPRPFSVTKRASRRRPGPCPDSRVLFQRWFRAGGLSPPASRSPAFPRRPADPPAGSRHFRR